ncbi:MAG: DUF1684 domain-containing protein [Phycisphaerales bacterium]
MSLAPLLILPALTLIACAASCSSTPRAGFAARDRDLWHADRLQRLGAEDGWLTLVGLDFLEEGTFTLGSSPKCALVYRGSSAPLVGAFTVEGDRVTFRAEAGASVTADGAPIHEFVLIADDQGPPTVLRTGTLAITLVRRNGELALRVKDNASPTRTRFDGIELYPFDPSLVAEARVEPAPEGATVGITNVTGFVEMQPLAATLRFTLGGEELTLVATSGANGRLFVVFGDTTNGRESYGGGRFLDIPAPVGGLTLIDFNRATNPPCSFTAFATCPTPPEANRLPVAVRGGERVPSPHEP